MPKFSSFLSNKLLKILPRKNENFSIDYIINRLNKGLNNHPKFWVPLWMSNCSQSEINRLMGTNFMFEDIYEDVINFFDKYQMSTVEDINNGMGDFFINFYLSNNILVKSDRASMLNGIEFRSPFLSKELINLSMILPSKFKFKIMKSKFILREILKKYTSPLIYERDKKGFGIPLLDLINDIEKDDFIPKFSDHTYYKKIKNSHITLKKDYRHQIWNTFILDNYLRNKVSNRN